jgi:dihydrofolate synthase/folylpolyglutamate synthase
VEVLREAGRRAGGQAGSGTVARTGSDSRAADVRVVPPEYVWSGPLALLGAHQRRNAGLAHAILMALPTTYRPDRASIERGFGAARVPGRFDRRGKWLFDVAHNPDGMRTLVAAIEAADLPRPLFALVSILGDKAWPEMLVRLDSVIDRGICTIAPTAAGRRWDLEWLRRWLKDPDRPPPRASWSLIPEFHQALEEIQRDAGTVLVTGSFHTVGDVMSAIGMEP